MLNLARGIFEEQTSLERLIQKVMLDSQDMLKCERCTVYLTEESMSKVISTPRHDAYCLNRLSCVLLYCDKEWTELVSLYIVKSRFIHLNRALSSIVSLFMTFILKSIDHKQHVWDLKKKFYSKCKGMLNTCCYCLCIFMCVLHVFLGFIVFFV